MVDDEPDVTFTFEVALEESRFFQVDVFNDPILALSGFRSGVYDLALLDIRMPEMNAYTDNNIKYIKPKPAERTQLFLGVTVKSYPAGFGSLSSVRESKAYGYLNP